MSCLINQFDHVLMFLGGHEIGKPSITVVLELSQRTDLERLVRAHSLGGPLARIVHAVAEELENKAICAVASADANTVGTWNRRFAASGIDGLYDELRAGAPPGVGG